MENDLLFERNESHFFLSCLPLLSHSLITSFINFSLWILILCLLLSENIFYSIEVKFYKYYDYLLCWVMSFARSYVLMSLSLLLLTNNFYSNEVKIYEYFYFIEWSAFQDLTFSCLYLICLYSFYFVLFLLSMIFQLITSIMWLSINFRNNISVSDTPSSFDCITVTFKDITSTILARIPSVDIVYWREWNHSFWSFRVSFRIRRIRLSSSNCVILKWQKCFFSHRTIFL